jgi:hypothetical protein
MNKKEINNGTMLTESAFVRRCVIDGAFVEFNKTVNNGSKILSAFEIESANQLRPTIL